LVTFTGTDILAYAMPPRVHLSMEVAIQIGVYAILFLDGNFNIVLLLFLGAQRSRKAWLFLPVKPN